MVMAFVAARSRCWSRCCPPDRDVAEPSGGGVVAYQFISSIVVMVLVLLAEGFGRSGEFELPVLLAVLMFGSGLVFVRALERWL